MGLLTDVKAMWEFESDGRLVDRIGGHTLTNNGAATFATGKVGDALDVEAGSSQYLSLADHADFSVGNIDFAIACWFNVESAGNSGGIVTKAAAADLEYNLRFESGGLRLYVSSASGFANYTNVSWSSTPSTATWYLAFAWHDATANTINIQVDDGTPVSAAYSAGSYDSGSELMIGGYATYTEHFDGLIDQVMFRKGSFWTTEERTELYNGGDGVSYADIAPPVVVASTAAKRLLLLR